MDIPKFTIENVTNGVLNLINDCFLEETLITEDQYELPVAVRASAADENDVVVISVHRFHECDNHDHGLHYGEPLQTFRAIITEVPLDLGPGID